MYTRYKSVVHMKNNEQCTIITTPVEMKRFSIAFSKGESGSHVVDVLNNSPYYPRGYVTFDLESIAFIDTIKIEIDESNVSRLFHFCKANGYFDGEAIDIIKDDPKYAYEYVMNFSISRFEKGEDAIATDPNTALSYAQRFGRFEKGEEAIATDAECSYKYAFFVLGDRFKLGESIIATDRQYAYEYACHILKGRFPQAEYTISEYIYNAANYAMNIMEERWPEIEDDLFKFSSNSVVKHRYLMAFFPLHQRVYIRLKYLFK